MDIAAGAVDMGRGAAERVGMAVGTPPAIVVVGAATGAAAAAGGGGR